MLTAVEVRDKLDRGQIATDDADLIARQAASVIRDTSDIDAVREAVAILGELSLDSTTAIQEIATRRLFTDVIEPFNDSFEPHLASLSDELMAQVIERHRRSASGAEFDRRLSEFGLNSPAEMLSRKERSRHYAKDLAQRAKKIFVLSRITVGADVAVTSVIVSHLKSSFQAAELVLVGPAKLKQLFADDIGLSFLEVEYARSAALRDRLNVWLSLVDELRVATQRIDPHEFLVIDPDSRLTQLGLLPTTVQESSYRLFDSRVLASDTTMSLAEIASEWSAEQWPSTVKRAFPFVAPPAVIDSKLKSLLDAHRNRTVGFVSLGVGGNDRKRLTPGTEELLIRRLAMTNSLILDSGATEGERAQVKVVTAALERDGHRVIEAEEGSLVFEDAKAADVLVWHGGIGSFSNLVGLSDFYVGYDSAGQHIAAALKRPVLTLFARGESARFANRWRATGPGPRRLLLFDPDDMPAPETIVSNAVALIDELRSEGRISTLP